MKKQIFKSSLFVFLLVSILTILLSLFAFHSIFNLAFWGDDWLIFGINKYLHGPASTGEWNYINHFFTLYGSQAILFEVLKKLFGMNPFSFYATSFFFRLIAALSLFPLVLYLTKSKLAAAFSSLFFSIIYTGLETSEYLPHATSYLAILFLNFFFYTFIRSGEEKNIRIFIISITFFFLTFISAPIRMIGLVPFVLVLELANIINRSRSIKYALVRTSAIFLIFILINIFGNPFLSVTATTTLQFRTNSQAMTPVFNGLKTIFTETANGKYLSLFSPLISIGNAFIPDALFSNIGFFQGLVVISAIFIVFSSIFITSLKSFDHRFKKNLYLSLIAWAILMATVYELNLSSYLSARYAVSLLVGGYILIFGIFLVIKSWHQRLTFNALIISLTWLFLSSLAAWLYSPAGFIPSTQRYLIGSTVGVSLFLATLLALSKNSKLLLGFLALLLLSNLTLTQKYWVNIEKTRSYKMYNNIWSSFPYYPEVGKDKDPDIFYFMDDGTNSTTVHDLITFGFPPHMDLLYNLNSLKGDLVPVPMSDIQDVISAVESGKTLKAYSYPTKPVPINKVYAFKLEGQDHLVNITDQIRNMLNNLKGQQP